MKLLDFGIAKLLGADEDAAFHTMTEQRVMTPDYANPEQVRGEAITTASDVYSLGVVLYELLTGTKPYRLTSRSTKELESAITEQTPERPSTAVTSNQKSAIRNQKFLKGDLDNIVLKAMRKEPERRYASVGQLSEGIRRHLEGLPVLACKDTFRYRSAKFVRRHRVGAAAAALILLSLIAGLVATAFEARRVDRQRALAEERFNDVRHLAHSLLFEIEPQIARLPGSVKARETLIKRALEYLDSLAQAAAGDRSLQSELASAYLQIGTLQGKPYVPNLGDTAGALASFRKAQTLLESLFAAEPRNRTVQRNLGAIYRFMGNILGDTGDIDGALKNQRKAVTMFEALTVADPHNTEFRKSLVEGYNYLATAQAGSAYAKQSVGQYHEALGNHRRAIAMAKELSQADPGNRELLRQVAASDQRIGDTLRSLDECTGQLQDYPEALAYDEKARAIFDALAAADPNNGLYQRHTGDVRLSIGQSRVKLGNAKAALETFRQALSTFKVIAEADPLDVQARFDLAEASRSMGEAFIAIGEWESALEYSRKALALYERFEQAAPERTFLMRTHDMIGGVLSHLGNNEEAIRSYR